MKAIVAEHTEEDREPTDTHSRSTLHPVTYYRTRENTQIGIDSTKALWSAFSNHCASFIAKPLHSTNV